MPMYPPGAPTISGQLLTVDTFLRNPTVIRKTVEDLTRGYFVADFILSDGPRAEGGAVIYDQVTATSFFTDRDVQAISPGSAFPIVDAAEINPKVAEVVKWGGAGLLTYEDVRRNRTDKLQRMLTRLRNTIVRKVDTVTFAAIDAAPIHTDTATGVWNDPAQDPMGDIADNVALVGNQDMGYEVDTVITNHLTAAKLFKNDDVRAALPRERPGSPGNPIINGQLQGFMGLNWVTTPRVAAGTVYFVDSGMVGNIIDELPLYTRVVNQETHERWLVMGARVTVPIITDPKAVVKMTGA